MLIVEVGFKLDKTLEYYDKILKMHGLENDFNCETHDIYYTKDNLNELTENEMKQQFIRLRNVNFKEGYKVENKLLDSLNIDFVNENELLDFENKLKENGYLKVFDTKKKDHHYYKAEHECPGADGGFFVDVKFGQKFFYNNIHHSTGRKSQSYWKYYCEFCNSQSTYNGSNIP